MHLCMDVCIHSSKIIKLLLQQGKVLYDEDTSGNKINKIPALMDIQGSRRGKHKT